MTEQQLRELKAPCPKTKKELNAFIDKLLKQKHDYGTCVYAMSLASVATFNFISHKLGVTEFQASCADIDIIRRTRSLKRFKIVDYEKLLYPQYLTNEHFASFNQMLNDNKIREWLREEATSKIKEHKDAHPDVINHWKKLISNEYFNK